MNIGFIPEDSRDRICASQVIASLSACVRELVENALDASATSLSIRIRGNADEVEIADNGRGIAELDWDKVCLPHSTSKLVITESMSCIGSDQHGFRGEALSALCRLCSKVRIVTRTQDMESGCVLTYDGTGKLVNSNERVSKSPGTTVTAYGLFRESLPVRHIEMLNTMKREVKSIQRFLTEFAIVNHSVKFELLVEGKILVTSPGGGDPYQVYQNLVDGEDLVEFNTKDESIDLSIRGWIKAPTSQTSSSGNFERNYSIKSRTDHQFFFLNGKCVDTPKTVLKTIAKFSTGPTHQIGFIIQVNLPVDMAFDRNVAVDKRQVLFASSIEDRIVKCISEKIESMSRNRPPEPTTIPRVELRSTNLKRPVQDEPSPVVPPKVVKRVYVNESTSQVQQSLTITRIVHDENSIPNPPRPLEQEISVSVKPKEELAPICNFDVPPSLPIAFSKDLFNEMEIVGQFNNGFIITRIDSGCSPQMFLIDQHAANEKFLFEHYYRNIQVHVQALLAPKQLKLSPATEETVVDHAEALQESGFRIEVNEAAPPGSRILVHSLPTLSGIGFNRSAALTVQDMLEIVARIEDEVFVQEEKGPILLTFLASVRSMFASKACRTAVMVGDILQVPRMHEIVQSLSNLENPWNCPHGRPTMKHLLSIQDLDRLV